MTEQVCEIIRVAVTLSRKDRIGQVAVLRARLEEMGYDVKNVREALTFWSYQERKRP